MRAQGALSIQVPDGVMDLFESGSEDEAATSPERAWQRGAHGLKNEGSNTCPSTDFPIVERSWSSLSCRR